MLYLAYGSNMSPTRMKDRCPNAIYVDKGYLKGYKLVFDGHSRGFNGLVATIVPSKDSIVPYVLWEVNDRELLTLDSYEGFSLRRDPSLNMYNRAYVEIPNYGKVLVYLMTDNHKRNRQGNYVSPSYINHILEDYTYFALDQNYLDKAIAEASK